MKESGLRVLVIDDEPQIRKFLKASLTGFGFTIKEAECGREGLELATTYHADIFIVDLGLPDMDGKQVIKALREWTKAPIIVLSAKGQDNEKIEALDNGADDYVMKPFSIGELMARIRVCLRRASSNDNEPLLHCGDIVMDLIQRKVYVKGNEVKLTPTEYDILKILTQNAGRVITHKQLLEGVWGNTYGCDTHYVRVYIGQLRRKIETDSSQPVYIITEAGIGYRMAGQ